MPAIDYTNHDVLYRRLRAEGAAGWDPDAEYLAMLTLVRPLLLPVTADFAPSVLEIGCGAGNFSLALAGRGYGVTGIDLAPAAIEWAAERARNATAPEVNFRIDNALDLATCADASFDAVVDDHCLHCIIGDDRALCLAAVRRVLKPGGVFVIITMCGEIRDERILRQFDPQTRWVMIDGQPTRYVGTPEALEQEVAQAQLDIDHAVVCPRESDQDTDTLVMRAVKRPAPTCTNTQDKSSGTRAPHRDEP